MDEEPRTIRDKQVKKNITTTGREMESVMYRPYYRANKEEIVVY